MELSTLRAIDRSCFLPIKSSFLFPAGLQKLKQVIFDFSFRLSPVTAAERKRERERERKRERKSVVRETAYFFQCDKKNDMSSYAPRKN